MNDTDTLPNMPKHPYGPSGRGRVFAFMTGERVTPESAERGDFEESGWVDPSWSRRMLHESRNDVRPLMSEDTDSEDLADAVTAALAELGAYADNGDGTFYGQDSKSDFTTGDDWTYAVHFTVKYRDPGRPDAEPFAGYIERDWHPSETGIDLD